MSLTLATHIKKQSNLKGYKPRVGLTINDIGEFFSTAKEFVVDDFLNGTAGETDNATPTIFEDGSEEFEDNGAKISDTLVIVGGANAGNHAITAVSGNTVTCAGSAFATLANQVWKISRTFKDELSSGINVSLDTDQTGGLGSISGITLTVKNEENWTDIFDTYPNPENSTVKCYVFFDDTTTILMAEGSQFYEGVINEFTSVTLQKVTINVKDSTKIIKNSRIPKRHLADLEFIYLKNTE